MTTCDTTTTDGDTVTIMQGETKTFLLVCREVDPPKALMVLDAATKGYFTIRERYEDVAHVILKRSPTAGGASGEFEFYTPQSTPANSGRALITLRPADTSNLRTDKTYVCDVWLVLVTGEHRPVVRNLLVTIVPRVTHIP